MARLRCRIGPVTRTGTAIDVAQEVDPADVVRAVTASPDPEAWIAIHCDDPPPVYDHVGHIHDDMGLRIRTALAKAGRARGLETPCDDELATARQALAELDIEEADTADRRREAADAASSTARLRERAATLRGRLQVHQEHGLDPETIRDELATVMQRLSEAETTRAAADQDLERTREAARDRRDNRQERFRLEDKVANLERQARSHLVETLRDPYREALETLANRRQGVTRPSDPFDASPVPAALAIVRLTPTAAPVALESALFHSAEDAANWLETPVLRL